MAPFSEISVLVSMVTQSIKYLGVTLDKTLNFNQNINLAVEKATKNLGIHFVVLKARLNTMNKIFIYKFMMHHRLEAYACSV